MKVLVVRKLLLGVAAIMMMLSTGGFTAGAASASTYPQAQIERTLFINPYDYTTGPAYLPYSAPQVKYLTAGTYGWWVYVIPTWNDQAEILHAFRSIYLQSNWYYWRCYVQTVLLSDGDTGAANYCSLTPTDGSTPTAYLVDTVDEGINSEWAWYGAGDFDWISQLLWQSNP